MAHPSKPLYKYYAHVGLLGMTFDTDLGDAHHSLSEASDPTFRQFPRMRRQYVTLEE